MTEIPPWTVGPFELILHAEEHLRSGGDFDRRISLISFDDAIEVSITTYLSLNPIQRRGRTYTKEDKERWFQNYHTKLDFLDNELRSRNLEWEIDRPRVVWVHDHRNEQYHGGAKGTPEKQVLELIRKTALWVFSTLFEIPDIESFLERQVSLRSEDNLPKRNDIDDRLIDSEYGTVTLAGRLCYVSEVLYSYDPVLYSEIVSDIKMRNENIESENS